MKADIPVGKKSNKLKFGIALVIVLPILWTVWLNISSSIYGHQAILSPSKEFEATLCYFDKDIVKNWKSVCLTRCQLLPFKPSIYIETEEDGIRGANWLDNHSLEVHFDPELTVFTNQPSEWFGITITYIADAPAD